MRNETVTHPILPICLMLEGKPCLVVGGGPIAARKAGHLLEAKANVSVVSPDVIPALATLAQEKRIQLSVRAFTESDLDGKYLVFAATDNEAVNREILNACRHRLILCSATDSNWPHGDFMMPATCRKNGLVVTVSTGGRSCRQSRVVKDRIAELLTSLSNETPEDNQNDNGQDDT